MAALPAKCGESRIGVSAGIGEPSTAAEMVGANTAEEGVDRSPSDAAQQLSASAWLVPWSEPATCEEVLCIVHDPSSEQHAIRAAALAVQPAHTTDALTGIARVSSKATRVLVRART